MDYTGKTQEELIELLRNSDKLTLEAKIALRDTINENFCKENMPDMSHLERKINVGMDKIKDLHYLNNLGFTIAKEKDQFKFYRSKSSKRVDIWGIILSILFILILIISVPNLYIQFAEDKIYPLFFSLFLLGSVIGIIGVVLFINIIDRLIYYNGFRVVRDKSGFTVKIRESFNLVEYSFSLSSKFVIDKLNDKFILKIVDVKNELNILEIKKPSFQHAETLKSLVYQLNL